MEVLTKMSVPFKLVSSGKVRDTYDLGESLLMVATDRLSAFDVVFSQGIPFKGAVLTELSSFWFKKTEGIIKNHLISTSMADFGSAAQEHASQLDRRSMLVKRAEPIKAECIVRGFVAGGGWKSYKEKGEICGMRLPPGLKECGRLPEPIFTPTTKAETGHDENVTREELREMLGRDVAGFIEEKSLKLYEAASKIAESRGIIIADTKLEFGKVGEEIILIDEAFTPDSSRFWPLDGYEPGRPQKSFDKQFVREYLEGIKWDKKPPAPELPKHIIEGTTKKYIEAFEKITGEKFRV